MLSFPVSELSFFSVINIVSSNCCLINLKMFLSFNFRSIFTKQRKPVKKVGIFSTSEKKHDSFAMVNQIKELHVDPR